MNEYLAKIKTVAPNIIRLIISWLDQARRLDFLAPLALRLYLAPIMWMAGSKKLANFSDTAEWFGNSDWGLGLPLPYLLVALVALTEVLGAVCLLFGVGVRIITVPLLATMLGAAVSVHLPNGWLAIAEGSGFFASEATSNAVQRLDVAKQLLQDNGDYQWLTEYGNFVVLNNGIEFAVTYFIMLMVLFFVGAGDYLSVDYWLKRKWQKNAD